MPRSGYLDNQEFIARITTWFHLTGLEKVNCYLFDVLAALDLVLIFFFITVQAFSVKRSVACLNGLSSTITSKNYLPIIEMDINTPFLSISIDL